MSYSYSFRNLEIAGKVSACANSQHFTVRKKFLKQSTDWSVMDRFNSSRFNIAQTGIKLTCKLFHVLTRRDTMRCDKRFISCENQNFCPSHAATMSHYEWQWIVFWKLLFLWCHSSAHTEIIWHKFCTSWILIMKHWRHKTLDVFFHKKQERSNFTLYNNN